MNARRPTTSELEERARQARAIMRRCELCPRRCAVDRVAGERGFCGLDVQARCFREVMHWNEERMIAPSHQVYFSGCNLRCEFCGVAEWCLEPLAAPALEAADLARTIRRRRREGARTLNILGGEPTVSLAGAMELLALLPRTIPVVWNSNMYYSDAAARLLDGAVDIYLADYKCGNAKCARQILGAANYLPALRRNLHAARRSADLIVRHVMLPGHGDCCRAPMFDWLRREMPDVKLSLWRDYMPPATARHAPASYMQEAEYQAAVTRAMEMGLNLIS